MLLGNMANAIMEGRNAATTINMYEGLDYSNEMVWESSFLANACATLYTDVTESYMWYQNADIIGTARCLAESKAGKHPNIPAVMEGIIKGAIDKIVAAFKKFITKVKEIYNKVISWFKAMFADAESFVKQFGEEMSDKANKVKGYSYKGYEYKKSEGDALVDKATKACQEYIKELLEGFDYTKDSQNSNKWKEHLAKASMVRNYNEEDDFSASECVEEWMNNKASASLDNASDSTELRENIINKYRNDASEKTEIKDFSAVSAKTMLDFLKNSKSTISDIDDKFKKIEKSVNDVIKKLNGVKVTNEEDQAEKNQVAGINRISQVISSVLSLMKVPFDAKSQIYKEMASEYLGALKGFYRYKPAKESAFNIFVGADAEVVGAIPMVCFESGDASDTDTTGEDDGDDKKPVGESASFIEDILSTVDNLM